MLVRAVIEYYKKRPIQKTYYLFKKISTKFVTYDAHLNFSVLRYIVPVVVFSIAYNIPRFTEFYVTYENTTDVNGKFLEWRSCQFSPEG